MRSGYKIALFEHTQYDKENDKHVFVGLELRLIADDYSGGEYVAKSADRSGRSDRTASGISGVTTSYLIHR